MPELAIESSPASSWGSLFSGILNTAVDTGAKLALQNAETKQKETLAAQNTATEQAKATAAASTATTSMANASTNWQRIALFAGIGVVGLVAIGLVVKSIRK